MVYDAEQHSKFSEPQDTHPADRLPKTQFRVLQAGPRDPVRDQTGEGGCGHKRGSEDPAALWPLICDLWNVKDKTTIETVTKNTCSTCHCIPAFYCKINHISEFPCESHLDWFTV